MYSMVLMMALSGGGAEVPAWHGCRGCNGCYGGSSCHGCWGGCHGRWGGHSSCNGCWGGSCHGCRGGGHFFGKHGCRGCHGCNGGCYGSYASCYGGGYSSGCYGGGYSGGCYGGHGCYGGGVIVAPASAAPAAAPAAAPMPKQSYLPNTATIVVSLPVDAKLMIDDSPTTQTSATRVFASPALEPGKEYVYTLKATVEKDGKPVSMTKRVTVRANEETRVNLDVTESVASR